MSMRELARKSGLSPAQISRIEAGEVERPTAETLTQLAQALDRSPQLLLAALDRLPESEAVDAVFLAMVEAIPWVEQNGETDIAPDADPDLAEAFFALLDQRRVVDELHSEGISLDGEAAAAIQVRDSWRAALEEANERAVAAETARSTTRKKAEGSAPTFAEAKRSLEEANAAVADVQARIEPHQRRLDLEEERLESAVREWAAQLFVRGRLEPLQATTIWVDKEDGWSELRNVPAFTPEAREQLKRTLALIGRGTPAAEEIGLDRVAEYLALFADTEEGLLADARRRLTAFPNDRQFRELARVWERLTPERKRRVVEFVHDQGHLSVHELVEEQREEVRTASRSGSRSGPSSSSRSGSRSGSRSASNSGSRSSNGHAESK